jgi:hypothetical protein
MESIFVKFFFLILFYLWLESVIGEPNGPFLFWLFVLCVLVWKVIGESISGWVSDLSWRREQKRQKENERKFIEKWLENHHNKCLVCGGSGSITYTHTEDVYEIQERDSALDSHGRWTQTIWIENKVGTREVECSRKCSACHGTGIM